MPMLNFQCSSCGLFFEKFTRDKDLQEMSCLSCGEVSPRQLNGCSFVFGSGKTPGNTGVDSLDTSVDKAVGRNADSRWEVIKNRRAYKRSVQHDNGGIGEVPLARNEATGEYIPVPKEKLPQIQNLHKEYQDIYKSHKQERESKGVGKFDGQDTFSKPPASKGD
jgi:hypothetical protein